MKKEQELKQKSMELIGKKIRVKRINQNLSIEELAANSNLHRTTIGEIERGKQDLTLFTLLKIAVGLGLDNPSELLHDLYHSVYPEIQDLSNEQWK